MWRWSKTYGCNGIRDVKDDVELLTLGDAYTFNIQAGGLVVVREGVGMTASTL